MSEYWYIATGKLKFRGTEEIEPINLELWQEIVESDPDMFWFEDTALGKEYFNDPRLKEANRIALTKRKAQMELNPKWGNGKVQFNYNNKVGYIPIIHTRKTIKRIQKYYEISRQLKAKLFRNKTEIHEEKLKQLLEKMKR